MLITGTPVTCTKADFGNIISFTAITHIWVIYTFIIDYLHENNILMLAIHFALDTDTDTDRFQPGFTPYRARTATRTST